MLICCAIKWTRWCQQKWYNSILPQYIYIYRMVQYFSWIVMIYPVVFILWNKRVSFFDNTFVYESMLAGLPTLTNFSIFIRISCHFVAVRPDRQKYDQGRHLQLIIVHTVQTNPSLEIVNKPSSHQKGADKIDLMPFLIFPKYDL